MTSIIWSIIQLLPHLVNSYHYLLAPICVKRLFLATPNWNGFSEGNDNYYGEFRWQMRIEGLTKGMTQDLVVAV